MEIQDFSITQIFREINVRDFRGKKTAILAHFEGLDLDFHEFLLFLNAEIHQMSTIQYLKNGKKGIFRTSRILKIDFT